MRNLFLLSLLFIGCGSAAQKPVEVDQVNIAGVPVTVVTMPPVPFDSCAYYRRQRDTFMHKFYMANQKVNTTVFYIKCVKNKPANKKFFWGWVTTRAMVDHPVMDSSPTK